MTDRVPGRNPFEPSFEQLPETLPIFPLSGVLLLPGGKLPLNIFEPRYLAMIFDCAGRPSHDRHGAAAAARRLCRRRPADRGRPAQGAQGRLRRPHRELQRDRGRPAAAGALRRLPLRDRARARPRPRRLSPRLLAVLALSRRPRPCRRAGRARPRAADGGAGRLLPRPQPVDRLGRGEAGGRRQSRDLAVDGPALRPGREAGAAGSRRLARRAPSCWSPSWK